MSLRLYYHPLSSFCWKALVGLYELGVPFEKVLVDLSDPEGRAAFARLWPLAKFPVLRDEARDRTIPESTILLEYAETFYPGTSPLVPKDPEGAIQCRFLDRFYDWYVHVPMQAIVGDRLRAAGERDPVGVARARGQLEAAYALADRVLEPQVRASASVMGALGEGPWAMGEAFTLADCAAMPALFYGDKVAPVVGRWPNVSAYLDRLKVRPSVARVLEEAAPYLHLFPGSSDVTNRGA